MKIFILTIIVLFVGWRMYQTIMGRNKRRNRHKKKSYSPLREHVYIKPNRLGVEFIDEFNRKSTEILKQEDNGDK